MTDAISVPSLMPERLTQLIRIAPAVLLALVLALRVVASPILMAAPEPGMIAVCAGGQIYYVTLDGTPVDGTPVEGDPCPFLGVTLALDPGVAAISAPERAADATVHPLPQATTIAARRLSAHGPRAPPFAI